MIVLWQQQKQTYQTNEMIIDILSTNATLAHNDRIYYILHPLQKSLIKQIVSNNRLKKYLESWTTLLSLFTLQCAVL